MWHLVTVERKGNAPWADDATRRTPYTRHAFPPWNIIIMGRGSILVCLLGINCLVIVVLQKIP